MQKNRISLLIVALIFGVISCKNDDNRSCVSCTSPQTPSFEVCEESDGTASVNGENTGTSYDVYISGLVEAGASCGI
jgi:hypothetical protein